MAVEKAKSNKAIATNFPPNWPRIPCENALAVNSAELTKDLPLKIKDSTIFPLITFIYPV